LRVLKSLRNVVAFVLLCAAGPGVHAQSDVTIEVEASGGADASFRVRFDPSVQGEVYSGRVYVAFLKPGGRGEPRTRMGSWFNPPPLLALDVEGVEVGGVVVVDGGAIAHPVPLSKVEEGVWQVQAVARKSLDSPNPGRGAGDLYSEIMTVELGGDLEWPIELVLDRVVEGRVFPASETVKHFSMTSEMLSAFHGRPITMHAGVALPTGWAENPNKRYPIVYHSTGFGGNHFGALGMDSARNPESDASQVINVVIDATCFRGHSVFADSANNGPWGTALVEELIPALEEAFRGPLDARYRYVTGGSSGGWASLWLQVAYPDAFGACYSHVPDPVDFRDFQQIDLYAPGTNMFVDADGNRRPLARMGGEVRLWYDDFVSRETALGPGGQISSFEACFSPRGADGEPMRVFDRETGAIDVAVAKEWEKYDIRLVLERDWERLGPKLTGKVHVYAGEVDTFYLEGAVVLLKASLEALGSDAVVEIIDGMAHRGYQPGRELMYSSLLEAWAGREGADN
jgi:Putative esterase